MSLNDLIKFAEYYKVDFDEDIKCLIKSYTNEEVLDKLQDVGIYKGQLCIIPLEQAYNADSYRKFGFLKEDKYVYKKSGINNAVKECIKIKE